MRKFSEWLFDLVDRVPMHRVDRLSSHVITQLHRFPLLLESFGCSLWSLFEECVNKLAIKMSFQLLNIQMDCLLIFTVLVMLLLAVFKKLIHMSVFDCSLILFFNVIIHCLNNFLCLLLILLKVNALNTNF
jgi:hypothetical protein